MPRKNQVIPHDYCRDLRKTKNFFQERSEKAKDRKKLKQLQDYFDTEGIREPEMSVIKEENESEMSFQEQVEERKETYLTAARSSSKRQLSQSSNSSNSSEQL